MTFIMPMQVIDLTHMITHAMPVFPGSHPVVIQASSNLESDGFNELQLGLSTHTGTHIDCGYHLQAEGFDTGTMPPDRFIGPGLVIDCRHLKSGSFITRPFLERYKQNIEKAGFVLFFTGWDRYWGSAAYFADFPCPDEDAAVYLTGFTLQGVGIDAAGFDRVESRDLKVHHILLSKGMLLAENLTNLGSLPMESFSFCCFPLKLKQGDGSPVRAVGLWDNLKI